MATFFYEILYRPLFNALVFFYQYLSFGDLGVAIILFTIFIRLILFPLFYKGAKDQAIMQRLAPKIKQIQTIHKNDQGRQARAMLDLYKEHRVNPLSGFLLIFIQLPILIALYRVFLNGFAAKALDALYPFISRPNLLNHFFLGVIDLSKKNIIIVVLAAIAQYFQGRLSLVKVKNSGDGADTAQAINKQMVYLGPILTLFFLYFLNLPSAVALYWLTTSVFSVVQQIVINQKIAESPLGEIK